MIRSRRETLGKYTARLAAAGLSGFILSQREAEGHCLVTCCVAAGPDQAGSQQASQKR
jgi:hypothetical protein